MSATRPILVLGGGIAGITSAVEAAEAGCEVILLEKSPSLGGRVARTFQYFPKLCPPACGLEINYKRIRGNPAITVLTQAELESLEGSPGHYRATVKISPRYVSAACTMCAACAEVCPAERPDDFNYGLSKSKAVYLPHAMAYPAAYAIDRQACKDACAACADACKYGAVDLNQQAETKTFEVAAVIAATGWVPYDAAKLDNLGYGRAKNVVTNAIMERMASPSGPTGGKVVRPSDGVEPQTVAFVQCAGSRDENHLPYCSAVCCAASLKQATYIRAQNPNSEVVVFYIDIRTPGRLEDFHSAVSADKRIVLVKGKVAHIQEDPSTGDLLLSAEDVQRGKLIQLRANLVVLATGIVPQTAGLPPAFAADEYGFLINNKAGLIPAGCVRRPEEVSASVQDATGAALKALQCAARSAQHA
jgi:quinone-modifying oxidoreductase subunit QmoA